MEREKPMNNPNGNVQPDNDPNTRPTFTVEPETVEGCDCPDCRAGKHIYSLYEWSESGWQYAATSLQSYSSAEECKQNIQEARTLNLGLNVYLDTHTPGGHPSNPGSQ